MTEIAHAADRQFTADEGHNGPMLADVTCPTGSVHVTVDPAATVATVRVFTRDAATSKAADAVRGTRITQNGVFVTVDVPRVPGGGSGGGTTVSFGGGQTIINGVSYSGNVTVVNGQIRGGNSVQQVSTGVEVQITLPASSAVRYRGEQGSLRTVGRLSAVEANGGGSVHVDTAGRLKASVLNGSVTAGRITEWIDADATNGSVKVEQYAGEACRIRAANGSVNLTAAPAASGRLDIEAGNGSIRVYGVQGRTDLDVHAVAGNGTVRKF
ncbi:hypothetical protein ACFY0G_02145 [Streptomyces sp. NPDC001552]|uniref:hypothetical protein n=1 Tax=Streptomyces sp. NPDC001552 TaxID=3364587 RepID=UPI0036B37100